jgi:hypothetical protein
MRTTAVARQMAGDSGVLPPALYAVSRIALRQPTTIPHFCKAFYQCAKGNPRAFSYASPSITKCFCRFFRAASAIQEKAPCPIVAAAGNQRQADAACKRQPSYLISGTGFIACKFLL